METGVNVKVINEAGEETDNSGSNEELEQLVNADIKGFETFFCGLGNASLADGERAIIKTYLWYKTHPTE